MHPVLPDIVSIEQDLSTVHIVEPGKQADDGGLPATGWTDDGHPGPRWNRQRNILQDRPVFPIAEDDMLERDISLGNGDGKRPVSILRFRFLVHDFEDTFGTCDGGLEGVVDVGDLYEWLCQLA